MFEHEIHDDTRIDLGTTYLSQNEFGQVQVPGGITRIVSGGLMTMRAPLATDTVTKAMYSIYLKHRTCF